VGPWYLGAGSPAQFTLVCVNQAAASSRSWLYTVAFENNPQARQLKGHYLAHKLISAQTNF